MNIETVLEEYMDRVEPNLNREEKGLCIKANASRVVSRGTCLKGEQANECGLSRFTAEQ